MKDLLKKLNGVAKDLSLEEIAAALSSSKHGGTIDDPLAVAAFVKKG